MAAGETVIPPRPIGRSSVIVKDVLTPTFLVNGRTVVGALAYEDFRAILEGGGNGR